MSYQTLELYEGDKSSMIYMLDRLTIAKFVETTGKKVPDNYKFYYEGHLDYVSSDFYFENVDDFLKLSGIGKMKYRNLDQHEVVVSIHLYALDEFYKGNSTDSIQKQVSLLCEGICSDFGSWDRCTIEGLANIVGSRIFIRCDGMYGAAAEFCQDLLLLHNQLRKLMSILNTKPMGDK